MATRTMIAEYHPALEDEGRPAPRGLWTRIRPASALLGIVALGFWVVAVLSADAGRMNDYGLSSVLGWTYLAAVIALSVALAWELTLPEPRDSRMIGLVIALVLVLFGTACAVEPVPRLAVAWLHSGFIGYISGHGAVLPHYDARFDWPGFFSLGAVVQSLTAHSPVVLLRWAPVGFELLYLAPLRVLARASGVGKRAGWIGTAIFYATNWIEQDYFSPQALNMFFFLVVVASLFAFWNRARLPQRLLAFRRPATGRLRADRQVSLIALLVIVLVADVASHQLTPYALLLAMMVLYATGRMPGPELPVMLAVLAATWVSLAATEFWAGHLSSIFGGLGRLGASVHSNLGSRVTGSQAHRVVTDLRIGLSGFLFSIAALGVRRRAHDRSLVLLAVAPFLLIVVQSYGGEALLRAFLFSLPFAALLAGVELARLTGGSKVPGSVQPPPARLRSASVVAAALAVGMVWLTFVRGGNDAYVAFSSDERAAVVSVYEAARPGETVATFSGYEPLGDRGIGSLRYVTADPEDRTLAAAESFLLRGRPDWFVLGVSQERWGEIVRGWPPGWQSVFERRLLAAGYAVHGRWATATVLTRTAEPS